MRITEESRIFNMKFRPEVWKRIEINPMSEENYFIFLPNQNTSKLHSYYAGEFVKLPAERQTLLEFNEDCSRVKISICGWDYNTYYNEDVYSVEFNMSEQYFIKKSVINLKNNLK